MLVIFHGVEFIIHGDHTQFMKQKKILVSFEEISRVVVVLRCDCKEMYQKAVMHLQSCCFS